MEYIIALDFEAAGGVPSKHGFTQLGACLIKMSTGEVLAKFNSYANMTGYEWEERCVREFWSKFPERFEDTKNKTSDPNVPGPYGVIDRFMEWVDLVTGSPEIRDHVYVISDNAPFDLALLRYFSANRDILYMFGPYREMVDVSAAYMGMSRKPVNIALMDQSAKDLAKAAITEMTGAPCELPKLEVDHDHDAVNDAVVMGLRWAFFQRQLFTAQAHVLAAQSSVVQQ
jgi:hypothetical protein